MAIFDTVNDLALYGKLKALSSEVDRKRKTALKKRLDKNPVADKLEYLLGAFMEMYEPHLEGCVRLLAKKGYALHPSSGFGGKNSELQVISGNFFLNYIQHNSMEKTGIKFRDLHGCKSLVFWPEEADLGYITERWTEVIEMLPDKGDLTASSAGTEAYAFRRKYMPEDLHARKDRLFDRLKFRIQEKTEKDLKERIMKNPRPTKTELTLGLFLEELEPQVRQAVLSITKKGYSTDAAGFGDNPSEQMMEGDFALDDSIVKAIESIGVNVETNPSGYTRIHFIPDESDIGAIKKKWDKIISLLPKKDDDTHISMTKKARDFRQKFQP